jgi:hypothetical protein
VMWADKGDKRVTYVVCLALSSVLKTLLCCAVPLRLVVNYRASRTSLSRGERLCKDREVDDV